MVSISAADLAEKRELLYKLSPFSDGVKRLKRKTDLADFAYTNLKLNGSTLTREGIEGILDGITVDGVPVFEHRICESHRKLLSRFDSKIDMDIEVDTIILNEFCGILSGYDITPYRADSPCLYHLDFVPGDPERITSELADAFAHISRKFYGGDFCLQAADIHLAIVKVYPYSDGFSEMAARTSLQYELVKAGYFPVDIGLSEQEYNTILTQSVKTGDAAPFAEHLRTAVFRKLHMLIDAVERGL